MKVEAFPVYRVTARNTDPDSENPIHSDPVASAHGFRAGLVPGVSVYGYMTVPLVRQLGREWLERGSMNMRFRKPFYDGDDVFVRVVAVEGDALQVIAMGDGEVRVTAEAGMGGAGAWDAAGFPRAPLPEPRLAAGGKPGQVLGTLDVRAAGEHRRLVEALRDPLPVYSDLLHPTVVLGLSNFILMRNFALPPWIHVASELQNLSTARVDEALEARGKIAEVFSRKGNDFVVVEVLVLGEGGRPVQQVRHTAIWRMAPATIGA